MTTHTPWKEDLSVSLTDADGFSFDAIEITADDGSITIGYAIDRERARLIAVAPELLKLLSEQLEMWEKGIIVEIRPGSNFHLNVRDAIAKAEGK